MDDGAPAEARAPLDGIEYGEEFGLEHSAVVGESNLFLVLGLVWVIGVCHEGGTNLAFFFGAIGEH